MVTDKHNASVIVFSGVRWQADGMRRAYELILQHWSDAGMPPDRLACSGAGLPRKYATFSRRRRRLEAADWEQVRTVEMVRLAAGGTSELTEWSHLAMLRASSRNELVLGWVPQLTGHDEAQVLELAHRLLEIIGGTSYGYLFRQSMALCPLCYALGMGFGNVRNQRPADHRMNISHWYFAANESPEIFRCGILRDVYPVNFLIAEALEAPMGHTGRSLRDWIEADSERGTLRPVLGDLWAWRPPREAIPVLREALYRHGRLFDWRFRQPVDPLYRPNLCEPYEPPEPVPTIYQARSYRIGEPDLIC